MRWIQYEIVEWFANEEEERVPIIVIYDRGLRGDGGEIGQHSQIESSSEI